MFDRWHSNPRFPTLKQVRRTVYVDMYKALPGSVGGLVKDRNLTIRSDGLRLEAWMCGYQLAWIRTHDEHWLGIIELEVHSSNQMSSITMQLWLAPHMFQLERPAAYYKP
ncbi:hypothetical protein [Mycobacteroides abscessus]|uniref:hypothetical protein n=1 Tax=Mycobacteroides abscessus TaxID=36809 RepID=UPI0009A5F96D|nr:hypothetical protein [Mycobacteroides abscessus]